MDKRHLLAFGMGAASLALGIVVVRMLGLGSGMPTVDPVNTDLPPQRVHNLSGPYSHENLTIYLVHGDDEGDGATPLTLDEGMKRKLVVVHETGDVDELEIENLSSTEEIFVQAGDIVKGGKQDRVLTVDLIVPARSGRIPISSFCVEQGRWTARGIESMSEFNSAEFRVASKDLKVAATYSNSQAEVWDKVGEVQQKLSSAANTSVASRVSRSSLPLALENKAVIGSADAYINALRTVIDGKRDVIGFIFAINGEINSGDTYASSELFRKLWPKLLRSAAIEAVSESDVKNDSPSAEQMASVRGFMDEAHRSPATGERRVTDRIRISTRESDSSLLIESRDGGKWLHRNYLNRQPFGRIYVGGDSSGDSDDRVRASASRTVRTIL